MLYIDEQVCSRLTGAEKKKCKEMIDNDGQEFIRNIQSGMVGKQNGLNCFHFGISMNILATNASLHTASTLP